jgi:hypothetical protein
VERIRAPDVFSSASFEIVAENEGLTSIAANLRVCYDILWGCFSALVQKDGTVPRSLLRRWMPLGVIAA